MFSTFLRILKHRWLDVSDTRRALPADAIERLTQRVASSERQHTGEVRICIEAGMPVSYLWRKASPRERALALFGKLGVWDTPHNNGVLIYLLLAEHAIEVVADRGIYTQVPDHFWPKLVAHLRAQLQQGSYEAALGHALDEVHAVLVQNFPLAQGQTRTNLLPNAPVLV